jgi:hypothetical protein
MRLTLAAHRRGDDAMWAVMWAVGGVWNFISDLNALRGTVAEPLNPY